MDVLKQSTAATIKMGPFVDDTDGKTAETVLTIAQADIRISKNGGAFAQTNNVAGATHDENGYYGVPLDTTDTGTLGRLRVAISESGALPVWQDFMVVSANVYDSLVGGTDYLQTDVTEVNGDSTAADNLESDYDGTGYAKANSTVGTCTTNSDMRGTNNATTSSDMPTNFSSMSIDGNGVVDANSTKIGGQSLDNKVGSNLNIFYQNGGLDTTNTIDAVMTTGETLSLSDSDKNSIVSGVFSHSGITANGGVSFATMTKVIYAMARGKFTKSANSYTFYDDDGTTDLFTITISESGRTVA